MTMKATTAARESTPRIRLLLVDDSVDLAMALHASFRDHETIESLGFVDDSNRILETVDETKPQVVLLDLTMPGPDPLDALRALRARGSAVKVIAFSGFDDPETIANARAAGADAFLRKTMEPSEIADAVTRVAAR